MEDEKRWFSFLRGHQSGSVAVEFALVIPILIAVMVGFAQIVILETSRTILQEAAFNSARSAMVYSTDINKPLQAARRTLSLLIWEDGKPKVEVYQSPSQAEIKIIAKIKLLPLVRELKVIAGGSRDVELRVTALAFK